uniref:Putative mitochondrial/plastidial beta-ketoacyl-acp reductase n=1 Tax=Ixodes ricinus TaxID=34613 RepID=A0A0K8R4J0_IXORI
MRVGQRYAPGHRRLLQLVIAAQLTNRSRRRPLSLAPAMYLKAPDVSFLAWRHETKRDQEHKSHRETRSTNYIYVPPATSTGDPIMYEDLLLQRKRITSAISRGSAFRFMGTICCNLFRLVSLEYF